MRLVYHVMSAPQPLGLLFMASGEHGLRHVAFMDRRSLKRTIAQYDAATPDLRWEPSLYDLRPLADQLDQYFTGATRTLTWPLDPQGDELSRDVWRALLRVPYGETCTVAELAQEIGQPRNLRAVAQAVLTNPIAILVPCHRVLGADGKPSNYVGGLPRKKYLLDVEKRFRRMGGLDDNRVIGELVRRVPRPSTVRSGLKRVAAPAKKKAVAASARTASAVKGTKKRAK